MERPHTQELVKAAQAGSREALDNLFAIYRERLEARIQAGMGKQLREAVEVTDVLQDTFMWATRSIHRFRWRGEDSFYQWLRGIAEHMLLKAASHQKRTGKLELVREPSADTTSPSKMMTREERFARLQKALQTLSPEYREVIILSRIDGLRVKEIAERMNRSPNAVTLLLSRALKKLRGAFGDTESLHLPNKRLTD